MTIIKHFLKDDKIKLFSIPIFTRVTMEKIIHNIQTYNKVLRCLEESGSPLSTDDFSSEPISFTSLECLSYSSKHSCSEQIKILRGKRKSSYRLLRSAYPESIKINQKEFN